MLIVPTNKFRDDLSTYLDKVINEETPLILSRFGKPLWEVRPYNKKPVDFMKYFGFMGGQETGEEFVNRVRRNKNELNYVKKLKKGNG